MTVTGNDDVAKFLAAVGSNHGDSVERRVARSSIAAGLAESAKVMRSAAPNKTLKKAIGTRFKRNVRTGIHEAKAGENVGKKAGRAPQAHLLILGTGLRFTKSGSSRGQLNPRPFIRQAVSGNRGRITGRMVAAGEKRLAKELAKKAANA